MSDICNKQKLVHYTTHHGNIPVNDTYNTYKNLEEELNHRADIINKLQDFTSHLVNRLDEQDKRISSLLAYQKLSDWTTSNSFIITIQKLWRGYFVRKTIKMKVLELKKYLSTLCK